MKKILMTLVLFFGLVTIVQAETYEAVIGEKQYATIEEAITAVMEGETIKLLANISEDLDIPENKKLTIDLNNYNIERNITNNGDLIIVGPGELISQNDQCGIIGCRIKNNNILTLKKVKLEDKDNLAHDNIYNYGILTLEDVNFIGDAAVYTSFLHNDASAKVTIKSGTYSLGGGSFFYHNKGEAIIENGTFENGTMGNNYGKLTVNNGTFNFSNSNSPAIFSNGSDAEIYLYGGTYKGETIAWNSSGDITSNGVINVYDGTFETTGDLFSNSLLTKNSIINIYGGKFVTTTESSVFYESNNNNKIHIYGGVIEAKNSSGIKIEEGSKFIIGTNDDKVTTDEVIIYMNKGTLNGLDGDYQFFDGKIILKSEIENKPIIPEGYYIKYDDNDDETLTAYLAKTESEQEPSGEKEVESPDTSDNILMLGVLAIAAVGVITLSCKKIKA